MQQQSLKTEIGGGRDMSAQVRGEMVTGHCPGIDRSTLVFCGWVGELGQQFLEGHFKHKKQFHFWDSLQQKYSHSFARIHMQE